MLLAVCGYCVGSQEKSQRIFAGTDATKESTIESNSNIVPQIICTNLSSPTDSLIETECQDDKRRNKKRVSFADDTGRLLATVRQIDEASDAPPILTSPTALALIFAHNVLDDENAGGNLLSSPSPSTLASTSPGSSLPSYISNDVGHKSNWCLNCSQPASDYLKFRQTLQDKCIALENVVINNDSCQMAGTIRVKNLTFEKLVFLRYTTDDWASFLDVKCEYVPQKSKHVDHTQDTFQFKIDLPHDSDQLMEIKFCVFCHMDQHDYWDNGVRGENYELKSLLFRKPHTPSLTSSSDDAIKFELEHPSATSIRRLSSDAFEMHMNQWSEFSTLRHLNAEGPYW